jgi:hypothetical protein
MTPTVATDPVEEHVAALDRALSGPAEVRRGMVREVRDGLLDAAEAYRRGGVDAHRAAHLAVRDFGPVDEVAPLYQDELAAGQGRRTAQLLVVGVPGLVLGWDLLVSAGFDAGPRPPAAVAVLAGALDVAGVGVAAIALALVALTFRRTRSPRRVAAAAAVTTLVTVLLSAGSSVALNVLSAEQTWARLTAQPAWALAYLVSAAVLVLMSRSALRTVRALRTPAPC